MYETPASTVFKLIGSRLRTAGCSCTCMVQNAAIDAHTSALAYTAAGP